MVNVGAERKNKMRRIAHIDIYFNDENKSKILDLMREYCSASRSAYQAYHNLELRGNEIKNYVKKNYMSSLNQRYINDACNEAYRVRKKKVIFGGKKNWKALVSKNTSKDGWVEKRNNKLYSRGDKSHKGNPNIRIKDNKILVNNPNGRGNWVEGIVFLPKKFNPNFKCYEVRIQYKDGKFKGTIGWEEKPTPEIKVNEGAIGLDCNPDGIAVTEVDGKGNIIHQHYERNQRIRFAKQNKRSYDIYIIAKNIVNFALNKQKPLILEDLKFRNKNKGRKFNRMASNFVYRKLKEAIVSRARRFGIPVILVNPAFTSILGKLKYKKVYSLSDHNSAALVIGRRGMSIKEKQTFTVTFKEKKKATFNLEGRGVTHALTPKAYSYLQLFMKEELRIKPVSLTGTPLVLSKSTKSSETNPEDECMSIDGSIGEIPISESCTRTGRAGVKTQNLSFNWGEERHPSKIGG